MTTRLEAAMDAHRAAPRTRGMDTSGPMRAALDAADAVMFSEESIDQVARVVAQRIAMTCPSEPNPRTEAGVITRLVIEMLKAGRG